MYDDIVAAVIELMESKSSDDKKSFAPCTLRLAGHDFMDYRIDPDTGVESGGSDGCVNFNDADNGGLPQCVTKLDFQSVYSQFCT